MLKTTFVTTVIKAKTNGGLGFSLAKYMGVNIFVKINATKPKEKNFSALAVEADDSSSKLPLSNRISIIILGIVNKATDAGIANSKAYIIVFSIKPNTSALTSFLIFLESVG